MNDLVIIQMHKYKNSHSEKISFQYAYQVGITLRVLVVEFATKEYQIKNTFLFTEQNWAHCTCPILTLKSFGDEKQADNISFPKWSTYLKRRYNCMNNVILVPKLFWPTVRKNCSSDWEKLLKFVAEGREFSKFLRSLEQFIHTVKGQNNFR